jgi:hypothetical protein
MNIPIKAVLLSAFIFPGVGHFFLKKYITGTVLASASFLAGYYLFSRALQMSSQVVDKIQSASLTPDVVSIVELVNQQMLAEDAQSLNIATYVFIFCWLAGIVDSYRLGRLQGNGN